MLCLFPTQLTAPGARLLCIGAHPDDIEIGAAGTVLQLLAATPGSVDVTWVVCSGTPSRQAEARASATALCADARTLDVQVHDLPDGRFPTRWAELKDLLEALATTIDPDLVITTRRGDAHQDHDTLARLVPTAFRTHTVWGMEISKADPDTIQPSLFVEVPDTVMDRKIELLMTHFTSQRDRQWWDEELFRSIARLRGIQVQRRYAEAFVAPVVFITP